MDRSNNISSQDASMIIKLLCSDKDTIRFLWKCKEKRVLQLSEKKIPHGDVSLFRFILDNNWVEDSSRAIFEIFAQHVVNGVNSEGLPLSIELPIKFAEEDPMLYHHLHALFLRDDDNSISAAYIIARPFTTKETYEKQVISFFTSDKNPKYFTQRVKQMMNKFHDKNIAFVQFDVERFKLINEQYGVEAGDALLKYFSDSLSLICNDDQPFCRLTADLFMMIITFEEESDIIKFIRSTEERLLGYNGMDYKLVWGVCIVEDRSLHTRRHGDNATLARQAIKGNALNNIGFYNGSMRTTLHHQQCIEADMNTALQNEEFKMYMQPKHSISTGKIIGAEALSRWIHHERGMIPPCDYIPVFEKNGFILKHDRYIWERACKKIRSWIDLGIEPVPISVNISREYLTTFDVLAMLNELVEKYDIPRELLELEITETVDSTATAEIVKKMKESGFTMLMDDYGTGYSSVYMLKTTPFDVLKLDRSVLSEFIDSDRGRKIISHTISMSRDIGLDIIAEGVENYEQSEFLKNCGCDAAQGYYYSKPIPEEEFDKHLIEVNS